jgi:hypothetical protein
MDKLRRDIGAGMAEVATGTNPGEGPLWLRHAEPCVPRSRRPSYTGASSLLTPEASAPWGVDALERINAGLNSLAIAEAVQVIKSISDAAARLRSNCAPSPLGPVLGRGIHAPLRGFHARGWFKKS